MHTVVIRRDVYEQNRWVAQSLYKAFEAAKAKAYARPHRRPPRCAAMLPWLVAAGRGDAARDGRRLVALRRGAEPRTCSTTFLRYHHEQGLSKRRFRPEELFAPETLATFKV